MNKLITVSDARTLAALAEEKAIKLEMDAEAMSAADSADAEGSAQAARFEARRLNETATALRAKQGLRVVE